MAWTRDMYLKVYGNLNETIISYYIFFLLFWNHFTQNFLTIYNASLDFELLFKIIIFVSSGGKKHKLAAAELKKKWNKTKQKQALIILKKIDCCKTVPRKSRDGHVFEIIFLYRSHTSMSLCIIGVVQQDCYPNLSFLPCWWATVHENKPVFCECHTKKKKLKWRAFSEQPIERKRERKNKPTS